MNRRAAFTLIELLIVVAIIAALVGAALPYYQEYVKETRITKAKHELGIIKQALIKYDTMEERPFASTDLTKLLGRYLQDLPRDPWGRSYEVEVASGLVRSLGPDHRDSRDDFIVYYKPPLALVRATWVDSDHNSLVTASDVIVLSFSRFLLPGLSSLRLGNTAAGSGTSDLLFSSDVNIALLDPPFAIVASSSQVIIRVGDAANPNQPVFFTGSSTIAVAFGNENLRDYSNVRANGSQGALGGEPVLIRAR